MQENDRLDQISRRIIGAAIEVHRHLGPGLLESAYESCLVFELRQLGLKVEEQKSLPVVYKEVQLDCGYRLDMVVEDEIIVEIKAVEKLLPIHEAQLLSYLRLAKKRVGLLMNFHVPVLKNGLTRMSHRGGRSCEKVARSGDGGRSRSGNHRTDLHRRSCSPSSHRGFRFLVRERHTTPPTCFAAQLVSLLASFSSAELRLATAGAPGGIAPGKDNRSTATPRFCVP
jgi:GxxExxY protein